jgi:hypothetical protein
MPLFTTKDYNSDSGMQSAIWGPSAWHILHTTSFNYPVNPTELDKKHYSDWMLSFQYTLPCVYCRNNFKSNIKKSKFSMSVMKNRSTFSRFVYDFHNHVNKMLGKTVKISFDEVRDRYEHFRARCIDKNYNQSNDSNGKEQGCIGAMHGANSKCLLHIVPKNSKKVGFKMDNKCKPKKI